MKPLFQTILIITYCISSIQAQVPSCKTKVKANKNKTLVFYKTEVTEEFWNINDMQVSATKDSVHIQKNGAYITAFAIERNRIKQKSLAEYYPNGKLKQFDSLASETEWRNNTYYSNYIAQTVYTRQYYPSGILQKVVYYQKSGEDSLKMNWYPDGTLHSKYWSYHLSGNDSAIYMWNEKGILNSVQTASATYEFYGFGSLKHSETDTLFGKYGVVCKKAYYPSGVLKSVEYHFQGMPCHTWFYYTEQGTLSRTEKHPTVDKLPPVGQEDVAMAVEEPLYFTIVEVSAEFAGGEENLKKYLNEKLQSVTCESSMLLNGTYIVEFKVDAFGTVSFQQVTGLNSEAIQESTKQIINQMPRWKPAKRGGRAITVLHTLQLQLQDKK